MTAIGARYGAALLAVSAMSTLIGALLSVTRIGNLASLYLIPILAAATRLGRGPAIFASIAAFLFYDWFFVEPLHVFTIADPAEWVALLLFLITAVITSELAARERLRAQFAIRREREATLLYEALRAIAEPDVDAALRAVADRVRIELNVLAVAIELELAGHEHVATAGDASAIAGATHVLRRGDAGSASRTVDPRRPAVTARRQPSADPGCQPLRSGDPLGRQDDREHRAHPRGPACVVRDARTPAAHAPRDAARCARGACGSAGRHDTGRGAAAHRRAEERPLERRIARPADPPRLDPRVSREPASEGRPLDSDSERDEFAETIEQQADRL